MVLESAQMLSTALRQHGVEDDMLYRAAYTKHPCTIWAGESDANFAWLLVHGMSLAHEYTRRFGKTHKSQGVIERCRAHVERGVVPAGALTPHAQAMPDELKGPDTYTAYRRYLDVKYDSWRAAGRPPRWTPMKRESDVE
jgi:hypothetical protein